VRYPTVAARIADLKAGPYGIGVSAVALLMTLVETALMRGSDHLVPAGQSSRTARIAFDALGVAAERKACR
jgi:hypothetical protein